MEWFRAFLKDFRYGSRSLRASPGLAAAAIVTLALGIGANTAIFSVLQGVVLEPLPYHEPDRLVVVALFNRSLGYATNLSYPDFLDWQRNSRSFEQIAAFAGDGFDLTSPGPPVHVDGKEVSSRFFATLGVRFALGRSIAQDEDQPGGAPAVVISNRLWRDHLGGTSAALGTNLTLNGVVHTIAGVLPPDFRFGDQDADVYTALARRNPTYLTDRTVHDILCIARLRPGLSLSQALAEMNIVQNHIDEMNPTTERGLGAFVQPLKEFLVGDVRPTLLLLLGAVVLVLLIATANVANLLLARSAGRVREFAIRFALGASRGQIIRQLIAESLELSFIGGILGLALADWGVKAALATAPGSVPRSENIGVNTTVLVFAFLLSVIVGIVFGLFPALRSLTTDVQTGLKDGGRGVAGGRRRLQEALAVLQVALALILLTGGSLLFRTVRNLWAVNPGFHPKGVLTFRVGLSPAAAATASKTRVAYRSLVDRIRQIPGIEAADISALVPMSQAYNEGPFWIGPHQPASMAEIPRAIYYPTGPDYVRTMRIPLLSGRLLRPSDNPNSEVVVLVDQLLARRFFPRTNPVGQSITIPHWGDMRNLAARIVGVVGHVEHYGLDGSTGEKPQIYYSFYQLPDDAISIFRDEVAVAVRTSLDRASVLPAIREAVLQAGSDQPVYNVRTMEELVAGSMSRQRFPMILLVAFAGLALLLAFVGIYGVISYSTARRFHEIGIRIALGAVKSDVLRLVLGRGLRLAAAGVAVGALVSLVLGKVVSGFSRLLYGVTAADPLILSAVSILLIAAAGLACYLPARRAAALEPTIALRQD
jgi:putative ABC transport system permease protein